MIKIKNCVGLLKNTILVLFLIFSLFLFLNINVSAHITVPVGIPTITPSTDSGISDTDHITNEQNPSFTGNCQVGYTVVLFAGNDEIGSALCVNSRYQINVEDNIDEGVHALSIAYRIGSDTSRRALKQRIIHIDLTPATAIVKIDLIDASDTLKLPEDNLTSDTTPTFSGVCVRDVKKVLLYHSTQNGSIEIGKAVCENGKFEITSNRLLKDNEYNEYDFYVRSVDAAGNKSFRSLSLDPLVTINTDKDFYCKGDTALSGWAWSSNIGWIDFNCANLTTDADFGVDVDDNGKLSGFAWSSNIGWIDFGYYRDAKIDLSSGKINGNVRALAGEKLIDGWHGKISLNGMTDRGGIYGPKFNRNTGIIEGFAWGDEVVGWVSFGGTNDKYGVTYKPYTLSFSANKGLVDTNKVNYGGSVILSWKINWAPWVPQRDRTTYIPCTLSDDTNEWKAETELTATTEWTEKEVAGLKKDTTFTLKCGVAERSRNILVRSPPPTLNFFIYEAKKYTDRPDYINIAKGEDVKLIWKSTNTTSCQTILGTPRALNLKEQDWVDRDILENGQLKISNITEHNNFFFIKCKADCDIDYPYGITRKVQVDTGKPELEFYFSPDPVPFHSKVTLHWKTRFMNECVAGGNVPGFIKHVNSEDGSHSFTTSKALLPGRRYYATIKCSHRHISGYTEKTVNITPAINPGFEEF